MYKFHLKKKIILLLSLLIFITCNSIVTACNIDNLFIHRKGILNALNAPDNSLLQFRNALPSLLVENMVALKPNTFGAEKLNISLLSKDGPVLKNINYVTTLDNLKEVLSELNIDQKDFFL